MCAIKVEVPKLKAKAKIKAGKTKRLKLSGTKTAVESWTSSDTGKVTVDSKGFVTGVSAGTATVTAKIGSHEYKCYVTVV